MKIFVFVSALAVATAGRIGNYQMGQEDVSGFDGSATSMGSGMSGMGVSTGASTSGFTSGSTSTSSAGFSTGGSRTHCRTVFDFEQKEHCEPYQNRVCHTTHSESCSEVAGRNCRGVVSTSTSRQCFDVTETRCTLKEDVRFETVDVPFVVQKCTKVNERVCGTVHETDVKTKEEVQCVQVERDDCQDEDKVVNDRTCKTVINFDCSVSQAEAVATTTTSGGGYGQAAAAPAAGGYGSAAAPASAGSGSGDYGSSRNSYGQPLVNCRRTPETQCYNTPRTVSGQRCGRRTEEQCETLRVSVPFSTPKQSCHNEEKKVCQLEHRQQPKQVKKYEYTKQCRQVPRTVCENAESSRLVPSCVPSSHTECSYTPVEKCEDVPKQHCFTYTVKIPRQECTQTPAGYGGQTAEAQGGY